jgi:hypothetical protein
MKRDQLQDVIASMLKEGLFRREDQGGFPVLTLTEAGRQEMERLRPATAPAPMPAPHVPEVPVPQEQAPPAQAAHVPAATPPAAGASQELDRLIAALLVCEREQAKGLVEELRLFHPQAIGARLAARCEAAQTVREKARAVWAAGELCERHGLAFLTQCAQSGEYEVRRLAASALGKAARMAGTAHAQDLAAARAALVKLLEDPAPQVRQYAQSALEQFNNEKPGF